MPIDTVRESELQQALRELERPVLDDDQERRRLRDALTTVGEDLRRVGPRRVERSRLLGATSHLCLQVMSSRDVDRVQSDVLRLLRAVRRHLGRGSA